MTQIVQIEGINAASILEHFDKLNAKIEAFGNILLNKQKESENDYLTRTEVVAQLHITYATLHAWTRKKILTSHHIGKRVYYKRSEIEAVLSQKTAK